MILDNIIENTALWQTVINSTYAKLKNWRINVIELCRNPKYRAQFANQLKGESAKQTGTNAADLLYRLFLQALDKTLSLGDPKKWDIYYNELQGILEGLGIQESVLDNDARDNVNGVLFQNLANKLPEWIKQWAKSSFSGTSAEIQGITGFGREQNLDPLSNTIAGFKRKANGELEWYYKGSTLPTSGLDYGPDGRSLKPNATPLSAADLWSVYRNIRSQKQMVSPLTQPQKKINQG